MPLTVTQIRFLRAAQEAPLGALEAGLRDGLPHKGAVAHVVVRGLIKKGLLSAYGEITQKGRGTLMRDPQASSEAL